MRAIISGKELKEFEEAKRSAEYWKGKHAAVMERIKGCETWIQGDQIYINEQKAVDTVRDIIKEAYEY